MVANAGERLHTPARVLRNDVGVVADRARALLADIAIGALMRGVVIPLTMYIVVADEFARAG